MAQSVSSATSSKGFSNNNPSVNSSISSNAQPINLTTDEFGVQRTNGKITKCPRNHPLQGYKGLKKQADSTLKCRDLVYEPGIIYCHDSKPEICNNGFHFCEELEDVFSHYNPDDKNCVYYKVEAWGEISNNKNDNKCSSQFIMLTEPVSDRDMFLARIKPHLKEIDKILEANPNAIICGSLALILRGWIPYRPVGDIDIMLPSFQDFGQNMKTVTSFGKSGEETIQMNVNGIKFDLFVDPSETWSWMTIGDKKYKVTHVKKLIEAKMRYYMAGAHKHSKDLKNIFEQVDAHYHNDKNAFLKNGRRINFAQPTPNNIQKEGKEIIIESKKSYAQDDFDDLDFFDEI